MQKPRIRILWLKETQVGIKQFMAYNPPLLAYKFVDDTGRLYGYFNYCNQGLTKAIKEWYIHNCDNEADTGNRKNC